MKNPIRIITVSTTMCVFLLAGCTAGPSSSDNSPVTSAQHTLATTSGITLSNCVLSLQTEGYQNLSLKDFNAAVKEAIDKDKGFLIAFSELMEGVTPEDSAYFFVYETLNYSINEVISPQMGQPVALSHYLKEFEDEYTTESGETFYSFMFTALCSVEYRVTDEAGLTVKERDELLTAFQIKLQNSISDMNREQLMAEGVKVALQKIADNLCAELSTKVLVFENAKIQSIEIHDEGQEYQR